MQAAEKECLLGDDMHGGGKNHSDHEALLTQQVTCNVSQQYRIPCSILTLDASKCFDKIYPNIGSIALWRVGAPSSMCNCLMRTITTMSHRVRTAYGVLELAISQPCNTLWSGVGQGSGASGPIWLAIESIMIKALQQTSGGISVQSVDGCHHFRADVLSYIDDNNIITTYKND